MEMKNFNTDTRFEIRYKKKKKRFVNMACPITTQTHYPPNIYRANPLLSYEFEYCQAQLKYQETIYIYFSSHFYLP